MRTYERYVTRKQHEYGTQFCPPSREEVARFGPYLGDRNVRVTVSRTFESGETETRTGYIGITTGWKPAFLLISRINSTGSSDVLSAKDVIVATRPRRVPK